MTGELSIVQQGFEKAAAIPEDKPKWGTTPEGSLPGEAKPEGFDENQPVGDDAQNTRHLETNFNTTPFVQAEMHQQLGSHFERFGDGSRVSANQLLKQNPKTPARIYKIMGEALQRNLSPA